MTGADARLLFVVSSDFGELSNALGFVTGYPFRASLLLPERLHAANRGRLPLPAEAWTSVDDVVRRVDAERPDVVFLFSAYLYGVNRLLADDDVERLVTALGARVPLVTSDPFLGVLGALDERTFSSRLPSQARLVEHFARLARVLAGVPHLYHVPLEAPGLRAVSFWNPHVVRDAEEIAATERALTGRMNLDPPQPRWLFVLSQEDWRGQTDRLGRAGFETVLVAKLADAARAKRQPVLIGPPGLCDAIRGRAMLIEGVVLLPFASHDVFSALSLGAEHAFYWNVFSNSVPPRVLNHRPVFFFDPGHMVHAIPGLAAVGLRHYWAGVTPPYLDARKVLEPGTLAELAAAQDVALDPAREGFRASTRPDVLVDTLRAEARSR